ncbi:MAG: NUDIX hydrolase [Candidatus Njordarchaeia archaeon]
MVEWAYEMKFCPICGSKLKQRFIDGRMRLVCDNCGFVFWNNPIPVVAAIVPYDNGIILVKSSIRKTWGLPAGHVEFSDTAEERVIEEVKEETNLDAEIEKFLGTWKVNKSNKLLLVYSVNILGGEPKPGGDVEELMIASPKKALEILGDKAGGKALKKWLIDKKLA